MTVKELVEQLKAVDETLTVSIAERGSIFSFEAREIYVQPNPDNLSYGVTLIGGMF
jgi:hypothetical protein